VQKQPAPISVVSASEPLSGVCPAASLSASSLSAASTASTQAILIADCADAASDRRALGLKSRMVDHKWCCVRCTIVLSDGKSSLNYEVPLEFVKDLLDSGFGQENHCFVVPDNFGNPEVVMHVLGNVDLIQHVTSYIFRANFLPEGVSGSCVAVGLLVQSWSKDVGEELIFDSDLLEFEILDRCATHCIVGLPEVVKDGHLGDDTILDYRCTRHSASQCHSIRSGQFFRLMHGMWTDGELVDWYAAYLSDTISAACHVRMERSFFFTKLETDLRTSHPTNWAAIAKYTTAEAFYSRVMYPVFLENHFYLAVFDTPSATRASGRLIILDPYSKYSLTVSSCLQKWLQHRGFQSSLCNLPGGDQGDNITECGIYCLANIEEVLQLPPFFDIESWEKSKAAVRSVEDCVCLRQKIAGVLREHSIRWIQKGSAIEFCENDDSVAYRSQVTCDCVTCDV
jgi:hypothetical protein